MVSRVSTFRKLGVAARVAGEQAGRNRTLRAATQAVRATISSFAHVAHLLWLEVTGTVFLAIAAFGAFALVREYLKYQSGHTNTGRLAIGVCFTVAFGWFGLSSFLKVRRKSQRP